MDKKEIRKNKEKEFKIQMILNAFKRLINQRPWNEITMQDIADEAGFGKATLYFYFNSKEDIIIGLMANGMNMHNDFVQKLKEESLNPEQKIRRLASFRLEFAQRLKEEFGAVELKTMFTWLITSKEGRQYKALQSMLREQIGKITNFYEAEFEKMKAQGRYKDIAPRSLATLYGGSVQSIIGGAHMGLYDASEAKTMLDDFNKIWFGEVK